MLNSSEKSMPMPTSPEALLNRLEEWEISFTIHHHEPVFTVAQSAHLNAIIPALHTRNMFLRDKRKGEWLFTLSDTAPVDLKKLSALCGAGRFSFGSPDRLFDCLGVYPGSVTPFAAINASPDRLKVILEADMMEADVVAFHPLVNTMTVVVSPAGLARFFHLCGFEPIILHRDAFAPES